MTKLIGMPSRHGKSIKYNRFSKEEAIEICQRKLPRQPNKYGYITCYDCYYHDWKCELNVIPNSMVCENYRNDISYTNMVRDRILDNYNWCLEHLSSFCEVDKELFYAIYSKTTKEGFKVIKESNK